MADKQFRPGIVKTLYRNEMRMLMRDRRSVIMAIVLPLVVMPVMLLGSHRAQDRREQRLEHAASRIAVTGERAELARALLKEGREVSGSEDADSLLAEVVVADPEAALEERELDAIVEAGDPLGSRETVPGITIRFRGDRDGSALALRRVRRLHDRAREGRREQALQARGFPIELEAVFATEGVNLAKEGESAGRLLGRSMTLFLLLFLLSGGAVVASDSLAGEKERGTLETLLTSAVTRLEVIAAKHLMIFSVALIITAIQAANLFFYIGLELIPVSENLAAAVTPPLAMLLLWLYLPVAACIAGILLVTSGYAKTYKEAQLYFAPVVLLSLVPSLAAFVPGLPLRSAIAIVPIAGIAVAVKEVLIGSFDWPMLALAWSATLAAAAYLVHMSTRLLSSERLVTASEGDLAALTGGAALYRSRLPRLYASTWALLLVVAVNLPGNLPPMTRITSELLFNLIGVFMGGSFLMIRVYRLNAREALSLRPVHPSIWLAVLLGAPAAAITGVGVFRLASIFIPVPQKMLESFGQALAPEALPLWQMLFMLALLPAVCEELFFRGMLLYGLRGRLSPVRLVLVNGLVFGLFHVALFRILPAGYLGVVLAAVTLITGSIFPAMLWHALNNGFVLLMGRAGFPLEQLDNWMYALAGAILLCALWLLKRWSGPRGADARQPRRHRDTENG